MVPIETLTVPSQLWSAFRDHIYNVAAREQVGALLLRPDGVTLQAIEFVPLEDEYVIDAGEGVRWHARFNLHLLRRARAENCGILLGHAHLLEVWPRPSIPDLETQESLLVYFGKGLPNQTNVFAVFGKYGAFYARADRDGKRYDVRKIVTT